jgi:hypothetical protein
MKFYAKKKTETRQYKILFQDGDYEEFRFLGCGAV